MRAFPAAASVLVIGVGILVLACWYLDVELLKRIVPGFVAMNPATALSFILSGVALALSVQSHRSPSKIRIAKALSVIVLLIGLAKLIGIAANWHPNIDEWLGFFRAGPDRPVILRITCHGRSSKDWRSV